MEKEKDSVVDHIIGQHSIPGSSQTSPVYEEPVLQAMLIRIPLDPALASKFNEDLFFESGTNPQPESSTEVAESFLFSIKEEIAEEVTEESGELEWVECDATLPPGWRMAEHRSAVWSQRFYQSPCGQKLKSRDQEHVAYHFKQIEHMYKELKIFFDLHDLIFDCPSGN